MGQIEELPVVGVVTGELTELAAGGMAAGLGGCVFEGPRYMAGGMAAAVPPTGRYMGGERYDRVPLCTMRQEVEGAGRHCG